MAVFVTFNSQRVSHIRVDDNEDISVENNLFLNYSMVS